MDTDTAIAMLNLLLGSRWSLHSEFSRFIEHSKYRVINKDQWCNILEFSKSIHEDLSNYDVDGACKYKFQAYTILMYKFLILNIICF